jgi:hypothetical protein
MSATVSKTFLVCHGAWSAGWAWKKMHPLMQAAGHRLITPTGGPLTLPRSYIYATRITPADTFGSFARMTKGDPAWSYYEIDASHSPNVTAPEALMALLQKIAA